MLLVALLVVASPAARADGPVVGAGALAEDGVVGSRDTRLTAGTAIEGGYVFRPVTLVVRLELLAPTVTTAANSFSSPPPGSPGWTYDALAGAGRTLWRSPRLALDVAGLAGVRRQALRADCGFFSVSPGGSVWPGYQSEWAPELLADASLGVRLTGPFTLRVEVGAAVLDSPPDHVVESCGGGPLFFPPPYPAPARQLAVDVDATLAIGASF